MISLAKYNYTVGQSLTYVFLVLSNIKASVSLLVLFIYLFMGYLFKIFCAVFI